MKVILHGPEDFHGNVIDLDRIPLANELFTLSRHYDQTFRVRAVETVYKYFYSTTHYQIHLEPV